MYASRSKPEPEPVDSGPRGVSVADPLELARECGVVEAGPSVTLDAVVAYACEHDLVLRPRRDDEQSDGMSRPEPSRAAQELV